MPQIKSELLKLRIEDFSPDAIAESGQCFRMTGDRCGDIRLIAFGRQLTIQRAAEDTFIFNCSREEFDSIWRGYFDLDTDYSSFRRQIKEDDSFLRRAAEFGTGIRILRQEPFEMLISFIISQRKSIPAIRTSIERLCESFGEKKILPGSGERDAGCFYAFPKPEALAAADEKALSACGLGYRVSYVREAALKAASGSLKGFDELPTGELIEALMELKGVGIKVASCVALFGYHRLEVAPVDVWMKRVIDGVYGGSLPEEYSDCAGVIQQYLFNYARITRLGA